MAVDGAIIDIDVLAISGVDQLVATLHAGPERQRLQDQESVTVRPAFTPFHVHASRRASSPQLRRAPAWRAPPSKPSSPRRNTARMRSNQQRWENGFLM